MEPKPGQQVKVVFAGGIQGICRVVEVVKSTVYITSEERFGESIRSGTTPEPLVGLPIKDVTLM